MHKRWPQELSSVSFVKISSVKAIRYEAQINFQQYFPHLLCDCSEIPAGDADGHLFHKNRHKNGRTFLR